MYLIPKRKLLHLAAGLWLASIISVLSAAEPPSAPILRIEAGVHLGPTYRIATDATGRYVATVSIDKTARVWNASTGQLLKILRPPQGATEEGKLYAVAMSPDGGSVAVGGYTRFEGEIGHSIYVFQRESGKLVKRIGGLPGEIRHLAWSLDGRYLAAAHFSGGIRVFRTGDFSLTGEDRDYGDRSDAIDFDRNGHLASVSLDGFVRLYRIDSAGLRLISKKTTPGGKQIYSVKFSPDGTRLAIGFPYDPGVIVVDATTLDRIFNPILTGINTTVPSVAWSADGAALYGAFIADASSILAIKSKIRRWEAAGQGAYTDMDAADSYIYSIATMPQGGIAFAGLDGSWGRLDSENRRSVFVASRILSGQQLSGTPPPEAKQAIEQLMEFIAPVFKSSGRMREAPDLKITDCCGLADRPKVNGTPLKLEPAERAVDFNVAPDGQSFLLVTSRNLRSFWRNGSERWTIPFPSFVDTRLNMMAISADGRYAGFMFSDGTIRTYRYADGRELLAIYLSPDFKGWVMWTPSGYYNASVGAEEFIGWHVNRGRDEAGDFFPASRFRSQFHRPDVVARMLQAGDEAEALRLANAEAGRKEQTVRVEKVLPPVVDILSPMSGGTATNSLVKVRFSVRTPADAPVTTVRVRVNGQAVALSDARSLAGVSGERELAIPIPPQDSEIMIFAENKNAISTPGIVHLVWRGTTPTKQDDFSVKPKLYILAVGISEYQLRDLRLGFAAKDAKDFVATLMRQKGLLYRDVEVKLITDAAATRDEVVDGLEWIRKQVTNKDIGIVFLAGHGENDADGKYYFLPVNADPDKLKRTGVVFSEIRDTLAALPGKAVFFIDTCHSGNVLGTGRRAANIDITSVVNELASAENGVLVFSSSTGRQYSMEHAKWGNGAFTKAVVEGLSGRADYNKNGRITHKMLDLYISERVKELTGNRQTPVTLVPQGVSDFPVALVN